jgi:hypothetical protein
MPADELGGAFHDNVNTPIQRRKTYGLAKVLSQITIMPLSCPSLTIASISEISWSDWQLSRNKSPWYWDGSPGAPYRYWMNPQSGFDAEIGKAVIEELCVVL